MLSNNKPLGAIIGLDLLEKLQLEFLVKQAIEESRAYKTSIMSTEAELTADLDELERYANSQN